MRDICRRLSAKLVSRLKSGLDSSLPRPPNGPLLRALWSLVDGFGDLLKGSSGVLVDSTL